MDYSTAFEKYILHFKATGNSFMGYTKTSNGLYLGGFITFFESGYALVQGGGGASGRDMATSAVVQFEGDDVKVIASTSDEQ